MVNPPTTPLINNKTQMDIDRVVKALETIADSLHTLAYGPTRAGKPAGDGVLKILDKIASSTGFAVKVP